MSKKGSCESCVWKYACFPGGKIEVGNEICEAYKFIDPSIIDSVAALNLETKTKLRKFLLLYVKYKVSKKRTDIYNDMVEGDYVSFYLDDDNKRPKKGILKNCLSNAVVIDCDDGKTVAVYRDRVIGWAEP